MSLAKCAKCSSEFEVGKPVIEILNQLSFCAITINFSGMPGMECPKCHQKFVLAIQAFDMSGTKILHMPLPDQPQQSSILAPPAGFDPKRRIN